MRSGIGGLRSLLVDIYPPRLADGGLEAALGDLAQAVRSRGIAVEVDVAPLDLDTTRQGLVYRVARECLGNVSRHSGAHTATVRLYRDGAEAVLEIADDGVGFDVPQVLAAPPEGHFGLRVLGDVAADADARLEVASAPGAGTRWRLRFPA